MHALIITGWIVLSVVVYFIMGTFLIHLVTRWPEDDKKDMSTKEGAAMSAIWPLILILFVAVGAWGGIEWAATRAYDLLTRLYKVVLP